MNKAQFDKACDRAINGPSLAHELENMVIFDGYGYHEFEPTVCTIDQLAMLIRWQCVYLNGQFDMDALNELQRIGRRKFQVIDTPEVKVNNEPQG